MHGFEAASVPNCHVLVSASVAKVTCKMGGHGGSSQQCDSLGPSRRRVAAKRMGLGKPAGQHATGHKLARVVKQM
jgi:hypothetical protein